jgi:hypothetical protein
MKTDNWTKVMKLRSKDNRHKGVANTLDYDDIVTIVATAEYFGASRNDQAQIFFDLKTAKYRVFDWLAMAIQGRIECQEAIKVFTYSFLKVNGDVTNFIADLRETDYDIDREWDK